MKKLIRTLITALAAVIVAGTVASAAPSFGVVFDLDPATEEVSSEPTEAPEEDPSEPTEVPEEDPSGPTEIPEAEPTESPEAEPGESSSPESPEGSDVEGDSAAPDFSACVGLTGLENAICRHEALLVLQPENPGLANSLAHLTANLAKHGGEDGTTEDGTTEDGTTEDGTTEDGTTEDGTTGDGTTEDEVEATSDACPGKSCEAHGQGKAKGHDKAKGQGKAKGHDKH
jgi:hypothetical protein